MEGISHTSMLLYILMEVDLFSYNSYNNAIDALTRQAVRDTNRPAASIIPWMKVK